MLLCYTTVCNILYIYICYYTIPYIIYIIIMIYSHILLYHNILSSQCETNDSAKVESRIDQFSFSFQQAQVALVKGNTVVYLLNRSFRDPRLFSILVFFFLVHYTKEQKKKFIFHVAKEFRIGLYNI